MPCPLTRLDDAAVAGRSTLVECDKFRMDAIRIPDGEAWTGSTERDGGQVFTTLFVWQGGVSCRGGGDVSVAAGAYEFVLLPAALGEYELRASGGDSTVILMAP